MKLRVCFVILSFLSAMVASVVGQTAASKPIPASTQVPRLIRFSGVAKDESGKPISGVVGILFSLYKDQQAGAPLWMETQNIQADAAGHYTALLGSASADGVPLELFSSGEAQWLGVQIQGQPERPRVLLVSVPYALKAHEAETLSGRNISDFVLANDTKSQPNSANISQANSNGVRSSSPPPPSGPTTFTGSNSTQIVGVTQSGSGTGLSATATTHAAVAGTITGPTNTAVYGLASNTSAGSNAAGVTGASNTQMGPGVQGVTSSSNGFGVQGVVTAASGGTAVQGLNKATAGFSVGVDGETSSVSTLSSGVNGFEGAHTGQVFGVNGSTASVTTGAAGVNGYEGATTGQVYGVSGGTNSTTEGAAGVNGYEGATTGHVYGVFGSANSSTTNAMGVGGYEGATKGQVYAVDGYTVSTGPFAAGVGGFEGATTGQVFGVAGGASSTTNGSAGVNGNENAATGVVYGVSGGTNSTTTNAAGVNGYAGAANGQVYGVNGNTNSTGPFAAAVNGYEGAATGQVFGVSGGTNSPTNFAAGVSGFEGAKAGTVFGVTGGTSSTTNGAAGVNGNEAATTGQVYGVSGSTISTSNGAAGVNGIANGTTGATYGVLGGTNSTTGGAAGVNGYAGGATGATTGVSGTTNSSSAGANGVYGQATATTGVTFGVQGVSFSSSGVGVQGSSPNNAIAGFNQTCGSSGCTIHAGIAGRFVTATGGTLLQGLSGASLSALTQVFSVDASGNGSFSGNLNVTGKLTKGSGSFKIDHPLDPANKYLSHSFVESPDMMNVYNGNITTDRHGLATVTLPNYFEALNQDFRYQLTVIGKFAQAIVARKIAANRFVIRTNKPNVEVSWQVTGIRQDAYAKAYRIPVEEEKPPQEQGHYLHPELFGAPSELAVGHNVSTILTQAEIAREPSSTEPPSALQ